MFRLSLMHRCMNGQAPDYLVKHMRRNSELGYMKTRWYDKAHLNSVQTEWGKKSFAFKAAQEWNSLPAELREIKSTVVFRKYLKSVFPDQQVFLFFLLLCLYRLYSFSFLNYSVPSFCTIIAT